MRSTSTNGRVGIEGNEGQILVEALLPLLALLAVEAAGLRWLLSEHRRARCMERAFFETRHALIESGEPQTATLVCGQKIERIELLPLSRLMDRNKERMGR